MHDFDDIFDPTPQTDDFDKEAWAAKKKQSVTRFTLLRIPPLPKSARMAAGFAIFWICRHVSIATPPPMRC